MDKQKLINKRQSQISRLIDHRQGLIIGAKLVTDFVAQYIPHGSHYIWTIYESFHSMVSSKNLFYDSK